jgi:hypothetical protein
MRVMETVSPCRFTFMTTIADELVRQCRALGASVPPLVFSTDDSQGAYRQVPFAVAQMCVVCIYSFAPGKTGPRFYPCNGHTFGHLSSVCNFTRTLSSCARSPVAGWRSRKKPPTMTTAPPISSSRKMLMRELRLPCVTFMRCWGSNLSPPSTSRRPSPTSSSVSLWTPAMFPKSHPTLSSGRLRIALRASWVCSTTHVRLRTNPRASSTQQPLVQSGASSRGSCSLHGVQSGELLCSLCALGVRARPTNSRAGGSTG